jgi:hypothetical protein
MGELFIARSGIIGQYHLSSLNYMLSDCSPRGQGVLSVDIHQHVKYHIFSNHPQFEDFCISYDVVCIVVLIITSMIASETVHIILFFCLGFLYMHWLHMIYQFQMFY